MKSFSKTLAILLVMISIFGSAPKQTKAIIPVIDAANNAVNWLQNASVTISAAVDGWDKSNTVLEMALKRVAAKVLLKTTQRIVNWGTTGFQGNPFYVQDQGSFFRSIADQQFANNIDEILQEQCSGATCPYARSTAKALIKGYAASTPGAGTKYNLNQTLGSAAKDFRDDFSVGGWKGWDAYTQNPQNNYLGAYIETSKEVSDRIEDAIEGQKEELLQNNGFLSLRVCVEKKPKNNRGDVLEVNTSTKTFPHTTLSGNQVSCIEDPGTQAQLWQCAGSCTPRDKELSEAVRTQWEGRKCFDKKSTEVNDINLGLGLGNSTLTGGALGLNGDTTADDCARYETKTPGTLIQQQLNKALLVPIEEKLNAKSSGGSLVDMLVDLTANLLDKGLTSLVSKATTRKQTAVSSNSSGNISIGNTSSSWFTGDIDSGLKLEDELNPGTAGVKLKEAIEYTQNEITALNQMRTKGVRVPEEIMKLDRCLPGPDVNWEPRLREEFQEETRRLERIAEKDNNRGERADELLTKLKAFLEDQIQRTKHGLLGVDNNNIPSASIVLNRIQQKDADVSKMEDIGNRIAKKTSVLAVLEDIERIIQTYPSKITNGQFVTNTQQNINELRARYRQIERDIGNEEGLSDIRGELDIFEQDYKRSFDATDPESLISRCTSERQQYPTISNLDTNKNLFCDWDMVASGTLPPAAGIGSSTFIGPIINIFGSINVTPNINCSSYYQSNLGDYIR